MAGKCYLVGEIQMMGMRVDHDCGLAVERDRRWCWRDQMTPLSFLTTKIEIL